MEYTEQTSGAIRIYLTEGEFDMSQLTVVSRKSFKKDSLEITFGILAASHFVQFRHEGNMLSEVCACDEAIVPDNAKLLEYDFLPNIHTVPLTAQFLIFPYSFNFTYIDWKEGSERLKVLRSKKDRENVYTLEHSFPKHEEDIENPVTEIYVENYENILVHTVHTYPNEEMMVFTESVLKI